MKVYPFLKELAGKQLIPFLIRYFIKYFFGFQGELITFLIGYRIKNFFGFKIVIYHSMLKSAKN